MAVQGPPMSKPPWGLRLQLAAVTIGVALLTGAGIAALFIVRSSQALRDDVLSEQLATASLTAEFASIYVAGAQMAVDGLAREARLVEAATSDTPESASPDLAVFLHSYTPLAAITLFDLDGVSRATGLADPAAVGVSAADRDYFQEIARTKEPFVGRPIVSRITSLPVVPYAVPVVDTEGTMRAVLMGSISVARLSEALARVNPDSLLRISVVDRREGGTNIAHTDPSRLLDRPNLGPGALSQILAGAAGTEQFRSPDGNELLLAFNPIPGLPWSVVTWQPADQAMAPITRRGWEAAAFAAVAIVLAGAAGIVVSLRISHPVLRLRDAARRVAAGDLAVRVRFTQQDEIGQLGRAFDAMAESLQERSRALEAANREMEDFSYAVAHELRAPLRAIYGFSHELVAEHGAQLDEQARGDLSRIRAASLRMGQLIEGVLTLLRLGRVELRREAVDLSAIADTVARQLQAEAPDRAVRVTIAKGVMARGDPALLRTALAHLLGNAWKFTRPITAPAIAFGSHQADGATAYFVRDNGVGFDMAHTANLFGAFQRLHSVDEFEGNGVGLAAVQRIVRRHGGRVWAEAAPGKGATFWFTLEPGNENHHD